MRYKDTAWSFHVSWNAGYVDRFSELCLLFPFSLHSSVKEL